jgi:hypothetical protein
MERAESANPADDEATLKPETATEGLVRIGRPESLRVNAIGENETAFARHTGLLELGIEDIRDWDDEVCFLNDADLAQPFQEPSVPWTMNAPGILLANFESLDSEHERYPSTIRRARTPLVEAAVELQDESIVIEGNHWLHATSMPPCPGVADDSANRSRHPPDDAATWTRQC